MTVAEHGLCNHHAIESYVFWRIVMMTQSRSVNRVELIGLISEDPTWYGDQVPQLTTFWVVTEDAWRDADGKWQDVVEWHPIVTWGRLAEECGQFLCKGYLVRIEGRLVSRSMSDIQQNKGIYITEIVSDKVMILDVDPSRRTVDPTTLHIPTNNLRSGEFYKAPSLPDALSQRRLSAPDQ